MIFKGAKSSVWSRALAALGTQPVTWLITIPIPIPILLILAVDVFRHLEFLMFYYTLISTIAADQTKQHSN